MLGTNFPVLFTEHYSLLKVVFTAVVLVNENLQKGKETEQDNTMSLQSILYGHFEELNMNVILNVLKY